MTSLQQKSKIEFNHNWLSVPLKQAFFLFLCFFTVVEAGPLTLPVEQCPDWLRRDGIVMAGSWEPLLFRVRRDGADGYSPTDQQRAAYLHEHSQEMIAELKELGVNFIMMHCYKGAGLSAERESMEDAVKFARLCHDAGLHVGVYTYSGAFLWEPLFKEVPLASEWVLLNENGKGRTYGSAVYRFYWNRNHSDAQNFYRGIVRFAVNDIKADLLHFDNYEAGPGYDANSVQRFRQYLRKTFIDEQTKEAGIDDINAVQPPKTGAPDNLLRRVWLDFCCQSLADSYLQMSCYARMLREDILIECNPGGPGSFIRPPIDHGRLLPGGEAFWDEGESPGYYDGKLRTRIRTYKVARCLNNIAFAYTTNPLEMAESMAFNLDCLGCICWFEYGKIVALPGSKDPLSSAIAPFICFFHTHRDLFKDSKVIADVAVLRSFPSQVFADQKYARLTYEVEQAFIDNNICFQIIYNQQLGNLNSYRVLVLAGCVALSNQHIKQIEQYIKSGGRVCIIGPVATHDEWMFERTKTAFTKFQDDQVIRVDKNGGIMNAIRRACDNKLTLSIQAGPGLCSELTEQTGRWLVHLVNYHKDSVRDINVTLRLPAGRNTEMVRLISPQRQDDILLPFQSQDGCISFSVPEVNVYEIAVIKIK